MSALSESPGALAVLTRLVADRAANPGSHRAKICLFLGAGADFSSGGISFSELKRQAIEQFARQRVFAITRAEDVDARFESLFAQLAADEKALLVDWLFHRMDPLHPSDAYKLLVLLAEAGGIDSIVTTNFDGMLEKAQQELARDLFQVFAPGVARPFILLDGRFEPSRKPYLKLHGDIVSRTLVFLTEEEIKSPSYDGSMIALLETIMRTHDLVFAGYGGNDPGLARIIAEAANGATNRIFWCSPNPPTADAVLPQLLGNRIRYVRAKFDDLMMEIARPVLERPSLLVTEPSFLRCLFDWRLDYCNREYLHTYGERGGTSLVGAFARRPKAEDQVRSFLLSQRTLTVISGPSGFGKTTLGIRLHTVWNDHRSSRILLVRSRALPSSGDIEQHVVEQLGGMGSRAPFSLFRFERWLAENHLQLILYIDGINEFSPDLSRCVQLFRNVLRFCYFLPESNSAIRVIATVRQETWNVMLSHLDLAQLHKTMWIDTAADQGVGTIACDEFTDEELEDAITRLQERGYANIETDRLPLKVINQLHDPYLFGTMVEASHEGMSSMPGASVYQRAFETKLQRRGSLIDTSTLKDVLASLALGTLTRQQDRFRAIDVEPAAIRSEIIRLMKDLHVFVEAGDGYLQFDHDRTLEFFLALGLSAGRGPALETVEDLLRFIKTFRTQEKPLAAARLYFQLAPKERFATIERILGALDDKDLHYGNSDRELLFGFGREVLSEMTEQGEPIAQQYLFDVSRASLSGKVGPHLLRTAVQFGAGLSIDAAVDVLTNISHANALPAATEANVYAISRLVTLYLELGCPDILLSRDRPYSIFFGDPSCSAWQRMGRLMGFAAHLGPDNTHPNEYADTLRTLNRSLDLLLQEPPWPANSAETISKYFGENCDRLLFNATTEAINYFFHSDRSLLISIAERLAAGHVMSLEEFDALLPFTWTLTTEVHYHICHLLVAISSLNDQAETLKLVETRLASLSSAAPPFEIDFLHAALVYLHVLHNIPYDPARFAHVEERILRDWSDILLHRPGLARGERRGFQDPFDRVFEDGFGVIYPYGILLPSARRRRLPFKEYLRELRSERASQLPLYTSYLERFLSSGRIDEALQIFQALAGIIVIWPIEGLLTLRSVIGHSDPRVRRAVVRVLAEAFNRHPVETLWFLKSSGAAVSDEDLIEIKIRHDAWIGRRQVNEEEWARIGHFLLSRAGAPERATDCVLAILRAGSLADATRHILQILGLSASR